MVRPNQIISSDSEEGTLTFIMFARSEDMVKRRVLFLNFPRSAPRVLLGSKEVDDFVEEVQPVTEGMVNRYAVTLNVKDL